MVTHIKVSTVITGALVSIASISGLILTSPTSSADVVDDVSITVPVSCNITSDLDTPHTATINPGQYKEDIGTTTFKVFCNDNTGYALYAIGYSNEEYGNTNLLPTNTTNPAIATGLATSGSTSNWAMKLTPVTTESSGTEQPYVPTIESDTNGSFSNYHIVPEEYTKVATFTSTTDFTIGSSLTSTYRVFIQGKQPADTYQGKVKYTLVHPNDANPPEKPITPQETAKLDNGYSLCLSMNDLSNDEGNCGTDGDYYDNTKVKAFKKANSLPENGNLASDCYSASFPDYCNVADLDSYNPVYFFFDNTDDAGIIYWYSPARKVYLGENYSGDGGGMFMLYSNLVNISGLSDLDTSNVTEMYSMFSGTTSLTNIDALSNWDTSSVTNMSQMFCGASSLINIDALSSWDTSSVTDMYSMFSGASSLTNIDALSNWDTSSVTNMNGMFIDASSLTNIDGASNWDTSSVTNMNTMFSDTSSLTNIDGASNWDTSSVTSMQYMFSDASSLTDISGAANWNTGNVTDINGMFNGANNIDATVLNNWDVSKVTDKTLAFTCPADKRPSWY